jgi:hypothetical protein
MGYAKVLRFLPAVLTVASLGLYPSAGVASISVAQSINRTEMAFEDTAVFHITVNWDGPVMELRPAFPQFPDAGAL